MPLVSHLLVKTEELCRVIEILSIDAAQHISIPKSDLFICLGKHIGSNREACNP